MLCLPLDSTLTTKYKGKMTRDIMTNDKGQSMSTKIFVDIYEDLRVHCRVEVRSQKSAVRMLKTDWFSSRAFGLLISDFCNGGESERESTATN